MQSTTPSLCGSFLSDKRSLIAFTWTLTTVLTLAAFVLAAVVAIHTHTSYKRLEHYYQEQYAYNQQYHKQQNDEGGEAAGEAGASADREYEAQMKLSQMHSSSMTFVAVYTMSMALALSLYGSTAIVGFTSLRGVYIAPCFSYPSSSKLKVGIFGGAIIFFANLLLVCAVIFGEVRVEDWNDHRDEEREPYEVERIATVLAVTCMFLAALYTIFAILLFLYHGSDDGGLADEDDTDNNNKLIDVRRDFITLGETR